MNNRGAFVAAFRSFVFVYVRLIEIDAIAHKINYIRIYFPFSCDCIWLTTYENKANQRNKKRTEKRKKQKRINRMWLWNLSTLTNKYGSTRDAQTHSERFWNWKWLVPHPLWQWQWKNHILCAEKNAFRAWNPFSYTHLLVDVECTYTVCMHRALCNVRHSHHYFCIIFANVTNYMCVGGGGRWVWVFFALLR